MTLHRMDAYIDDEEGGEVELEIAFSVSPGRAASWAEPAALPEVVIYSATHNGQPVPPAWLTIAQADERIRNDCLEFLHDEREAAMEAKADAERERRLENGG